MNKFLKNGLCYILIAIFLLGVGSFRKVEPEVVLADSTPTKRSIQVTGQGVIKVKPDMARVTLGVETKHKNAQEAQADNTKKMNDITKILKELKIEEKDIQTSQYSIYPEYRYIESTGERKEDGYIVRHLIQVTVRDLNILGTILDKAVSQGLNTSYGIQFGVSNEEKYYQDALQSAIKNAQGKAEAIGQTISVKIDKPFTIVELGQGGVSTRYMENAVLMDSKTSAPSIEAGELDIQASVQVTYQY